MKNIIVFIINCLPFFSFAQFFEGVQMQDIAAIQKRKTMVIVEVENPKVIEKLNAHQQQKEIEQYRAAIKEFNAHFQAAVEALYPYNKEGIQYKTLAEAQEIQKRGKSDYTLIYCVSKSVFSSIGEQSLPSGLNWTWKADEDKEYADYFSFLAVNLIENLGKPAVYAANLPHAFPSKADLYFGLMSMQSAFDLLIRKKAQKETDAITKEKKQKLLEALKKSTLLIAKSALSNKLPEDKIGNYYPHPFKVCTDAEQEQGIIDRKAQTAYFLMLPYEVGSPNETPHLVQLPAIYDAATGELLLFLPPQKGKDVLDKNMLKELVKNMGD